MASIPGVALAANPCPSPRIKCRGQCCAEGVTSCQGTGKNKTCGPVPCQSGLTSCNGQCVDTATDATNCGSCGNTCNQGQSCVNGACVTTCPSGTTECNGNCVTNCTSGQVLNTTTCTCEGNQPATCIAETYGCCAGNGFCDQNASVFGTTCWTSGTCIQPGITGAPQNCEDCGASQVCVFTTNCAAGAACVNPCAS